MQRTGLLIDDEREESTPEYNPDDRTKRVIRKVVQTFEERDIHKRAYERTWFLNHCALMGEHWIVWNDLKETFTSLAVPRHRVRLVINMMLAYWRRTKARLTAHRPGLHVAPATDDETDAERARIATFVLDGEFERIGFQSLFKEWVGGILEAGEYYLAPRWNPWAGEPLYEDREVGVDPETGQPITERVPLTDEHGRHLRQGEFEIEIDSPYEFDIDPKAKRMDDAEWVRRSKIRSLTWIREQYPASGRFVRAEDVYAHQHYLKRVQRLIGAHGFSADPGVEENAVESSAIVHEYYERPTQKHPDGQLIVVAGGVMLFEGPNPYRTMIRLGLIFPFIQGVEIRVPGRFHGMAMIEQAFGLNRNLNRARSQEVENRTIHGRPKILVPTTSKIRQGSFSPEAGEKVLYTPGPRGERPELIWPQSTAAATEAEIRHSVNDIQEVLSYHEVSRGILPSANIPGIAVDKLQQADETALGETEGELRDGIVRLGRMLLAIVSDFWTEERLVRVTGEDGVIASDLIKGDQFAGDSGIANYFDVRMTPQSTMWRDPQQQRVGVAELMKMGLVDPVAHRTQILKMLDRADLQDVYKDDKLDTRWACRENQLMEQGQLPMPRDFENQKIHIQEHNRYRKSERYRALPPELRQLFDEHVMMHEQLFVQEAQKMTAMQVAAQQPAVEANRAEAVQDEAMQAEIAGPDAEPEDAPPEVGSQPAQS